MVRRTSALGSVMSSGLAAQPGALHGVFSHGHAYRVELRSEVAAVVVVAERYRTELLQRFGHQLADLFRRSLCDHLAKTAGGREQSQRSVFRCFIQLGPGGRDQEGE